MHARSDMEKCFDAKVFHGNLGQGQERLEPTTCASSRFWSSIKPFKPVGLTSHVVRINRLSSCITIPTAKPARSSSSPATTAGWRCHDVPAARRLKSVKARRVAGLPASAAELVWQERAKTPARAEWQGRGAATTGLPLMCGFYLNELPVAPVAARRSV